MQTDVSAWERFAGAASPDYPSARRLKRYLTRLFGQTALRDRQMCDVGGGGGMISFYAALQGANVTCLEPTAAGSNPYMESAFERYVQALPDVRSVRLVRSTFQQYQPEDSFDVVIFHNSVNHLDEPACATLLESSESREVFRAQFRRLFDMMPPEGVLIVSDCSRKNLFGRLGLPNPFVPSIEWHLHQQPSTWVSLLQDVGFVEPVTLWNPMTRAGWAGRALLANPLGAFLTTSHFTVRMLRGVDA